MNAKWIHHALKVASPVAPRILQTTKTTTTSAALASLRRPRTLPVASFHTTALRASDAAPAAEEAPTDAAAATEELDPHPTDIQYSFSPPAALSAESQQKVDTLFDKILWLDMIELHLLTQLVHEKMGGHWSDLEGSGGPVRAGAGAGGAAAAEEVEEAKTIFDLKLVSFDAKAKIKVIKEVRSIAGLGLKEAKELVEAAPKVVLKDVSQEKADELKAQLEAVGAQVEIS
eukprot:Nitzschia sp. Nitz4//scaffold148_size54725//39437//40126//NITZ4_006664-RA/size54725-processed-gene-0.26-mRNA-1//-1//CDS//3329536766//5267//frame0